MYLDLGKNVEVLKRKRSNFGSWAGMKQSQIKQPLAEHSADNSLSEPKSMHGESHALALAQLPQ